ncbi:MAG: hypothetical protein ABSH20_17390 [Tepidisphaeraceae bacterium]
MSGTGSTQAIDFGAAGALTGSSPGLSPVRALAEFEPLLVFASTDDPHLPAWRSIIASACGDSAAPRFVTTCYDTADAFMESALVMGAVIGRPTDAVQLVLSIMRGGTQGG